LDFQGVSWPYMPLAVHYETQSSELSQLPRPRQVALDRKNHSDVDHTILIFIRYSQTSIRSNR